MERYIAFLRAINVGGHTVKMDLLRGQFVGLGYAGVETFIASGNVIFETPEADARALERQIEAHLRAALGYEVATFLRTPAELAAVARHEAFAAAETGAEGALLSVAFLGAPPEEPAARRVLALGGPADGLHIHGREVYWLRRPPAGESRLGGAALERALGAPATVRNITTVRRLAAKYPPG